MGRKQKIPKNDNEVPQSESEDTPMLGPSPPATPPQPQLPSSEQPTGIKEEDKKNEEKWPTTWHQPVSPLRQLPSNPHPLTPAPKSSASVMKKNWVATCQKILEKNGIKGFQLGRTKVFLRAGQMAELDARGAEVLGSTAKAIQQHRQTHIARKRFIVVRKAAIYLQSFCKG